MKLKYNEFLAKVYSDIFDYPLTDYEARLWSINGSKIGFDFQTNFSDRGKPSEKMSQLKKLRKEREKISAEKIKMTQKIVEKLKNISTIEAIFLTGSVTIGNAKKDADIDLMIVTAPRTLWLTRLIVFLILKKNRLYKTTICPNIFLDTDHLGIKEKNLYTAHEVLQAKVLFDRSNVNYLWLKENGWTKEYLPKAYKYYVSCIKYYAHRENSFPKYIIHNTLYMLPELTAFGLQYLYMKGKITNEKVGWGFAFFHPRNLSKEILNKFYNRLDEKINPGLLSSH